MANSTVSVNTLANLLCLSERQIQNLANDGIVHKDARGQYELIPSVQGYVLYLQKGRKNNTGTDELTKIKTRKEEAKTRMAEMAVRQMEGELIPAADIGKAWTEMVAHMRAKLLALPNKLAPQLQTIETLNEIQALLKKQIFEALQELADTTIELDATVSTPTNGPSDDPEAGL